MCRSELDDTGDPDHYQERFTAVINIFVAEDNCQSAKQPPWAGHSARNISPDCLFSTRIEKDENFDTFGKVWEIITSLRDKVSFFGRDLNCWRNMRN
jgi:hypothetical protein